MSYREENRRRWATVAAGWEAHADHFRRDTMPVSTWMIEAIAPRPGDTLLELAAGIGDTGFLAAELIEPGGTLITSDLLPEMLSAAQRRAEQLGVRNVRFRQIDAEVIDQPAASLDGVLARWGYMLMADAEAALRDTRRVLKPGARVALAAWADQQANPWTVLPVEELLARGKVEPVPPGPGQFAWAEEGAIADTLDAAGFVEYDVEPLDFAFRFPSVRDWWDATRDMSLRIREAQLDADEEEDIVAALAGQAAPFTADDGSLAAARADVGRRRDRVTCAALCTTTTTPTSTCSRTRPWPSSATAHRATPTRSTSRTPASTWSSACGPTPPRSSRPARTAWRSPTWPTPPRAATS